MRVSFAKEGFPQSGIVVVPVFEEAPLPSGLGAIDKKMKGSLKAAIAAERFKGKAGGRLDMLQPSGLGVSRLVLIGLGKGKGASLTDWENFGALGASFASKEGAQNLTFFFPAEKTKTPVLEAEAAARSAFGAVLGSYRFDLYKSAKKGSKKPRTPAVTIAGASPEAAKKAYAPLEALGKGVVAARDFVSEPPNILYPESFAARVKKGAPKGLKVEILTESQMKKLGMNALLGVGQGSVRESRLVVMRWDGGKKASPKVAFIGKGVCFDTGGISLKPAGSMDEMKGDMGGAAAMTGLMYALAERKARVNAVAVLGLVENMPGGNAQRPGDIVRAMSGQTIEVLNTDAEGRLVLADALGYVQKRFKPKVMVDAATLTGAILVALGQDHAGLFSNDDRLAKNLHEAGKKSGEKVWRLPLGKEYDKLIDSKIADVKNIGGGRFAGSITAAQFLQRFVEKGVSWAHLDIAGTAWGGKSPVSPSWATGFGVRLLDRFVQDYCE